MTRIPPLFTFARGNAHKIRAIPLYALGVLASFIVPRANGLWVFGCGSGIGEGALALYRQVESEERIRRPDSGAPLRLLWLARDADQTRIAEALGIPAVISTSLRGFWVTLRAQVIVVTHGLGDVNRYGTRGAFILQLWHGIPLKRIALDSPRTTSAPTFASSRFLPHLHWSQWVLTRMYRLASSTISLVPVSGEIAAFRLRTAFGLPEERVVVTGDPRDDVLCRGTASERSTLARAQLFAGLKIFDEFQRTILYAPTWRDGDVDPSLPLEHEWTLITGWLRATDSLLIIRPHPLAIGSYAAGIDASERITVLDSATQSDITPVLAGIDLLITDYSSIALDFALLGRPIAFLAADLATYSLSRGLYENYDSYSGGTHVATWSALIELLGSKPTSREHQREANGAATLTRLADHANVLAIRYHSFRDGQNTRRVSAEVRRRLGAS